VSLQHVLVEEVGYFAMSFAIALRVLGVFWRERRTLALDKLRAVPVVPLLHELQVGSIDEGETCLYGDFSPRARPCLSSLQEEVSSVSRSEVITEVVAPVLQELCEEPSVVLPMKMGSLGALAVPMTPSAPLVEPC
jgi:hypothetical protein